MASGDLGHQHTREYVEATSSYSDTPTTPSLFDLLSNNLVLYQTLPYLSISSILNIAATARPFRHLLLQSGTPSVFRHLDLTQVKAAQFDVEGGIDHGGQVWRNVQVDENLTEDDFYSGPLRGIFSSLRRRNILQDVGTLVLDGLSVTAEFVNDILVDPASSSRIRILSIREAKNLNERKLMQSLRYACRPSRGQDMPRLKALYYFGKRDAPPLLTAASPSVEKDEWARPSLSRGSSISADWNQKSQQSLKDSIAGDGDDWYGRKGRVINKRIIDGWAETLLDCREVLQFDAVLCTGPRHRNSPAFGKTPVTPPSASGGSPWGVATFAVGGCASCGSAPEGFTVYGETRQEELPLLSPVPLHSSSVKCATRPAPTMGDLHGRQEFVPRCLECIRERYCFSCNQWWCEACYQVPSREEMAAAHHVHIVDEANGLNDHEMAAFEQPKIKVRTGYCYDCKSKVISRVFG